MSAPKLSLEALMSQVLPSLDTLPTNTAPKKFKRVRQLTGASTNTDTNKDPTPPTLSQPVQPAAPAQTAPKVTVAAASVTSASPATNYVTSNTANLPSDMAAAAAAAFASVVTAPSDISMNLCDVNGTAPAIAPGNTAANKKRKNRKNKKKNKGAAGDTSEAAPSATETAAGSSAKPTDKVEQGNRGQQSKNKGSKRAFGSEDSKGKGDQANNRSQRSGYKRLKKTEDPQWIARHLDAQPELVGVPLKPEDDFSALLLQHVETSNKILQRDLQRQSQKMLEDQKKQAALLTAQAAQLSNPTLPPASTPQQQQPRQGRQQKTERTFVPRKPCVYYVKGTCGKGDECTFRHDPADKIVGQDTPEMKKMRGICKYEKSGSCTKGEGCWYSHNLKDEPCRHYHLQGKCDNGTLCRFGHTPLTEAELSKLVASQKTREAHPVKEPYNAEVMLQMAVASHGTQGLSL